MVPWRKFLISTSAAATLLLLSGISSNPVAKPNDSAIASSKSVAKRDQRTASIPTIIKNKAIQRARKLAYDSVRTEPESISTPNYEDFHKIFKRKKRSIETNLLGNLSVDEELMALVLISSDLLERTSLKKQVDMYASHKGDLI